MLLGDNFLVSYSEMTGSDIGEVSEEEHWSDNYYKTVGSRRATMCCNCEKVEAL